MLLKSLFIPRDKVIAIRPTVCQHMLPVQYAMLERDHHFIQLTQQRHQLGNAQFFRITAYRTAGDAVVTGSLIRLTDKK